MRMTLCLPLMHFFYAFPMHNWWDTRVPRRLITVELGFAIELHAAYRYTFEEKRHRVLVNVVVTSRRSIARKKKKIACLPFFFSFFRANVRPTTFHFKQWIFIIALHKSETVSRFLFFKRYEISRAIVLHIKRVSAERVFFFFFQNSNLLKPER